ncbi:MAG: hypothetical protein H9533_10880 [Rhodobacteraceae bacterium]|nr:hypothetical protein [Paracoccaceae bacterium]
MCGWISDGLRRAQADLRLTRHFPGADALEALIELRVNMLRLVGEQTKLFQEGEAVLHGVLRSFGRGP